MNNPFPARVTFPLLIAFTSAIASWFVYGTLAAPKDPDEPPGYRWAYGGFQALSGAFVLAVEVAVWGWIR